MYFDNDLAQAARPIERALQLDPANADIIDYAAGLLLSLGRVDEARELFENMLTSRSALGLLSEDLNTETGEQWGNFPQTYSLVGIINAAMRLSAPWESQI